jgi:hypothetical protein
MKKEWFYLFKDGGWNSEYATSKEEAILLAKERWKHLPELTIDEKSFKLVEENKKQYETLLSNFD